MPSAIERLFDRINYERQIPRGGEFKLDNMRRLVRELGDPHLACPIIHVAGTKGKGSICAIAESILRGAGLKTGIYTSPHLESITQRIVCDGQPIDEAELTSILEFLEPTVQQFDESAASSGTRTLTFFEVITAAAFVAFSKANVDVVLLEVGMGGRLDSTNVCQPTVGVISNISLDHTRQLGSTIDRIAAEKAGIIKPGVPVVSGATDPAAIDVIDQIANENGCDLLQLDRDFSVGRNSSGVSTFAFISNDGRRVENLSLPLAGHHQQQNAAVAIAACQEFFRATRSDLLDPAAIQAGLAAVSLPARCEILCIEPLVIVDMAHNPASTAALARTLSEDLPEFGDAERRMLIFAASREKDVEAMLRPLQGMFTDLLVTRYLDNPRGRSADDVVELIAKMQQEKSDRAVATVFPTPSCAWAAALEACGESTAICVTGSAFLVAELRPLILQWEQSNTTIEAG